ncbi:WxL domain-containing protein [Weissella diestrammenae]|uniref:WxL domain-containing protein n=1 Tax=Weissella diestrammenae TaxID=1162633 RepID=A0A7G9T725_9LACO|nr:WxL domain-containing protein [Weissella diestrammenae]MCM0582503.1 WxL domain-containing protein [Weissella diestrammenae]QNN75900.1 WxL domain-containing protein [Weissella diestrammenae]
MKKFKYFFLIIGIGISATYGFLSVQKMHAQHSNATVHFYGKQSSATSSSLTHPNQSHASNERTTTEMPLIQNVPAPLGADNLYITYASPITFSPTANGLTSDATYHGIYFAHKHILLPNPDQVSIDNELITTAPFLQIHSATSQHHFWCATVTHDDTFTASNGDTLKNAALVMSTTDQQTDNPDTIASPAFTRYYNEQTMPVGQEMCVMAGPEAHTPGNFTYSFGKTNTDKDTVSEGLSVAIPAGTLMKNKTYQTHLTWHINDVPLEAHQGRH